MNLDPKQVSLNQKYEIYYIAGKYKIPVNVVKAARKKVGKSRWKIYKELREQGYTINTKSIKRKNKKK